MKRLLFYIRLYFLSISQYFKIRIQFRADFIISSFGMLIINLSGLFSLWIIFKNIPFLKGWNYYHLVFIYSFSILTLTPLQIFFDNIWSLRMHVIEGTFIKYYFRPVNMLVGYISEMIDLKGISQFIFGVVFFIISSYKLQIEWTPIRIALFPVLWLSASLIMISLMLIAASTSFWVANSFSILALVSSFREHARYPIGIYNSFFRFIFTYVIPIGFIAFYPARFYISDIPPDISTYLAPVFGIVLFIIAIKVWEKGTRVYSGTGS